MVADAKKNLVGLMEHYGIEMVPAGDEYKCACVFHEDSTPSMMVSPTKDLYNCFGCGAAGDTISFIMHMEKIDFKAAVAKLNKELSQPPIKTKALPQQTSTWEPLDVIPDDAPSPPTVIKRKIDGEWLSFPVSQKWAYRNRRGQLIGYTCRIELPSGKEVLPLAYGAEQDGSNLSWKWHGFKKPRPILGLELLDKNPTAKILIVEGEKTCVAAAELLRDAGVSSEHIIVLSWPGGAQGVGSVDWSHIENRKIFLWPDSDQKYVKDTTRKLADKDQPGTKAMLEIAALLPESNICKIVSPPKDVPDGWDLADELPEGFNIASYLKAAIPVTEEKKPVTTPVVVANPGNPHFTILGYDHNEYYIFQHERGKIDRLKKSDFTPNGLISVAPLHWWLDGFNTGKGKIDTESAFDYVARTAADKGIYDASRSRGRGAWLDDGRVVFHHGDFIIVDGAKRRVTDIQSTYVYEKYKSFPTLGDVSMTDEEGQQILDITSRFRWSNPASGLFLAGWIALSPVCGALRWRPHVWLSGGAGSGKSTILTDFAYFLLDGIAVYAQGNSTEAGLRQRMGGDAVPVLFDESESNTERDGMRIQNILSLIRQASTLSDGETMKGTASGVSMAFHIQSMFCLASIQTALIQQADKERVTVLNLNPRLVGSTASSEWSELSLKLIEFRSIENLQQKLMHRLINNLPKVLKNVATFIKAAAEKFGIQREGDQYGTLLAGAHFLSSTELISLSDARAFVEQYDYEEYRENSSADEPQRALLTLMSGVVRSGSASVSVHNLLSIASGKRIEGIMLGSKEAVNMLGNYGMKIVGEDLLFCNNHPRLNSLVYGTPFAVDLRAVILRIPGAKKVDKSIRFGGVPSKGYSIPIADILKED